MPSIFSGTCTRSSKLIRFGIISVMSINTDPTNFTGFSQGTLIINEKRMNEL